MKRFRLAVAISLPVVMAATLFAQEQPPPDPNAAIQEQPGQLPAPPAPPLNPQQLEDLVAPVALYPDTLLSQILVATTYPIEVVEAQQWLQQNRKLHGQQLMDAARQQNWDPSVQALVAFPDVLTRLNQDIRWTTDLGNAFLAQQPDVMSAVQQLRMKAQADGKLKSTPQQNVTTQTQNGQSAIDIAPADPGQIYVPNYNPEWVWGPPVYGYYPPLLYPGIDVGFGFFPGIDLGLYFGGGWGLYGGFGWGWGPNWFGGGLFVNAGFFGHYGFHGFGFGGGFRGTTAWAHDPAHRMGAGYSTAALRGRYGAASQAARVSAARSGNFRSFGGANVSAGYRGNAAVNANRGGVNTQANRGGAQGAAGYQRFQGGRQSYQAPAQRSNTPAAGQRYGTNYTQQRSNAPSTQHYSAPAAPHYSAPSGGARSFGGGGGSVSHGGGGGASHGGGGGHGGGRR